MSAVNSLFRNCSQPLFYARLFYVFALTPLANLHHFVICNRLIFGLAPFGWFSCNLLKFSSNVNTIFIYAFLNLSSLFQERKWDINKGSGLSETASPPYFRWKSHGFLEHDVVCWYNRMKCRTHIKMQFSGNHDFLRSLW